MPHEKLELLIDRIATPIGEMIMIADPRATCARSTGPNTKRA